MPTVPLREAGRRSRRGIEAAIRRMWPHPGKSVAAANAAGAAANAAGAAE